MLGPIVRWKLGSAEKRLGVKLDYLRHLYAEAPEAFYQFVKVQPLSAYRKHLPAAPFHIARIVATRHEDCGSCVQTVVNLALQEGVDAAILRAAVYGRPTDLPESLADVYRFAAEVVAASGEEGQYRDRLRSVFGEEALAELGMAIAFARVYPTMKRAMGFAVSCTTTTVDV
jgi:alkylhydroperoxidase family enzyme